MPTRWQWDEKPKAVGEANGENHDQGLEVTRRIYDVVYGFWVESQRQEALTESPPTPSRMFAEAGQPSTEIRDQSSLCSDLRQAGPPRTITCLGDPLLLPHLEYLS